MAELLSAFQVLFVPVTLAVAWFIRLEVRLKSLEDENKSLKVEISKLDKSFTEGLIGLRGEISDLRAELKSVLLETVRLTEQVKTLFNHKSGE